MPVDRLDHFIPAAYLGRFSAIETGRLRRRPLYVADRRAPVKSIVATAERLAAVAGLYDLEEPASQWHGPSVDNWAYEAQLPLALDQLIAQDRPLPMELWVANLVPFVAGLFARGPDPNRGWNTEMRMRVFQEILAPVMVSEWTVLHFPTTDVITSDRAIATLETPVGTGIAVPLTRSSALLLTRCQRRRIATRINDGWFATIKHQTLGRQHVRSLGDSLSMCAMNAIFGPTPESVALYRPLLGVTTNDWPALILNPTDCDLLCHLYDYFRVASAISAELDDAQASANRVDLGSLAWTSPMAVELLYKERTRGGVVVTSRFIELDMALGVELRRRRRSHGDFTQGAFVMFPMSHLRGLGTSLAAAGILDRGETTQISNFATGKEVSMNMDVNAIRRERRKARTRKRE